MPRVLVSISLADERSPQAGDYGSLNRETGQFERQGNIYKEIEVVNITSKFPPVIGPVIDTYQVASLAVKKLDTDYSVDS